MTMRSTNGPRSGLGRLHHLVTGRTHGKSPVRQWAEMIALYAVRGNGPGFNRMGGLLAVRIPLDRPWSGTCRSVSTRRTSTQ